MTKSNHKEKAIAATATATEAAAEFEASLHDNSDETYLQADRLLRTARVTNQTNLGDLDHVLAVDAIEQRLAQDLHAWFDLYDLQYHTAAESEVALALILLDQALDPYEDTLPVAA